MRLSPLWILLLAAPVVAERRDAHGALMRRWLVTLPSHVGHVIAAPGPVDRWRDHGEMIRRTPEAIALLDSAATPLPGTPRPTPSSEAPELRERVRSLEEKIEELERGTPQETP